MSANSNRLVLGDPVPWFRAQTLAGGTIDLHMSAGRWNLLAFLGSFADAHTRRRLAVLTKHAAEYSQDHLMIHAVLAEPPSEPRPLIALSRPNLKFIADYDGALGAYYGSPQHARSAPFPLPTSHRKLRTIALDPMLRAVANIPCEPANVHDRVLEHFLRELPSVDSSAGVPLSAPILMVPRVFEFPLCGQLVETFDKMIRAGSGFSADQTGKPAPANGCATGGRHDLQIGDPDLLRLVRERIMKRLLPAVELYFQFRTKQIDRHVIACYYSHGRGCVPRHRENATAGLERRAFSVWLNLNSNYEGCDLIFPEFGRRTYRSPTGGALVFSCSALYEITPITKGKRYVFLPFLYGEPEATASIANNNRLRASGAD